MQIVDRIVCKCVIGVWFERQVAVFVRCNLCAALCCVFTLDLFVDPAKRHKLCQASYSVCKVESVCVTLICVFSLELVCALELPVDPPKRHKLVLCATSTAPHTATGETPVDLCTTRCHVCACSE
jgi:hypothetical protein